MTRDEFLANYRRIRESDPRGPRPESAVERKMRECTDPAILAADPDTQYRYHLLDLSKDSSTVFTNAFLRLGLKLRAREALMQEGEEEANASVPETTRTKGRARARL